MTAGSRAAQENLAAASRNSGLLGDRHTDIGKIKISLETDLRVLFDATAAGDCDFKTYKRILGKKAEEDELLYSPEGTHIFHYEAIPAGNGVRVMCRVKDEDGVRTYYAVFSLERDEEKGFPIESISRAEDTAGPSERVDRDARNPDGTFKRRPGKSPMDALKVIVLSGLWERKEFTLKDFENAYWFVLQRFPGLGFEPPAENWQSTARRDLYEARDSLNALGLLNMYTHTDIDEHIGVLWFSLTERGHEYAAEILKGGGVLTFLAEKLEAGEAVLPEDDLTKKSNASYPKNIDYVFGELTRWTYFTGAMPKNPHFPETLRELNARRLVFIKAEDEDVPELDCVTADGKRAKVKIFEYMDERNIYVIIDENMSRELETFCEMADMYVYLGSGSETMDAFDLELRKIRHLIHELMQNESWAVLAQRVRRSMLHLTGNMCGLADVAEYMPDPYGRKKGYWRPVNDLDRLNLLTFEPERTPAVSPRDTFTKIESKRWTAGKPVTDSEEFRAISNRLKDIRPVHDRTILPRAQGHIEEATVTDWDGDETHEIEYRDERGRFKQHPGKSPEDAMVVIALSGMDEFSLKRYKEMYELVDARYKGLGFESLARRWGSTAERDLYYGRSSLEARGYLDKRIIDGEYVFSLTPKGKRRAEEIRREAGEADMGQLRVEERSLAVYEDDDAAVNAIMDLLMNGKITHLVTVPRERQEGNLIADQYVLDPSVRSGLPVARAIKGLDRREIRKMLREAVKGGRKGEIFADHIGGDIKVVKLVAGRKAEERPLPSKSREDSLLFHSLMRNRYWERLSGISGFLPSYFSVEGYRAGNIANRQIHVARGANIALSYAGLAGVDVNAEYLNALAYAHELGRLPFAHGVEKRIRQFFPRYPETVVEMRVGNRMRRRFNQTLAQDIVYRKAGIELSDSMKKDIEGLVHKDIEKTETRMGRLFYLADTALGYVEDLLLSYKLEYEGKRLVEGFEGRDEFLKFVLGTDDLSGLDALEADGFDAFVIRATAALMERIVDPSTLSFREDQVERIKAFRDRMEEAMFPVIDDVAELDSTIIPVVDAVKDKMTARMPEGLSAKKKEQRALESMLEMTEAEMFGFVGADISMAEKKLGWIRTPGTSPVPAGLPDNNRHWIENETFESRKEEDPQPEWMFDMVAGMLPSTESRILEVGCGSGRAMERLMARGYENIKGYDISARFLAQAAEKGIPAGKLELKDIKTAEIQSDNDLILASDVLLYFTEEEREELMHKFVNALNPGGVLALRWAVGNDEIVVKKDPDRWVYLASKDFLLGLMKRHGLEVAHIEAKTEPIYVGPTKDSDETPTCDYWYVIARKSRRDESGRFKRRPGKSPEDALKVIAMGITRFGIDRFTLKDFGNAYRTVQADYPEIRIEPLAKNWESTARRDLYIDEDSLEAQGLLGKDLVDGEYVFELTEKGKDLAEQYWQEVDDKADTERYVRPDGSKRKTLNLDSDRMIKLEEMKAFASKVGIEIAPPVAKYTLFVPAAMFKNRDYENDKVEYADRFSLRRISTDRPGDMVKRVLGTIQAEKIDPANVIVQLPKEFAEKRHRAELSLLLEGAPGIRFMIVDTLGLKEERKRAGYRRNIYSMMLLARRIDKDTPGDSMLYRLFAFFISRVVGDKEDIVTGYIKALTGGDINALVRTVLSYKPVEKYAMPDYDQVAETLMSA